MSRELTKQRLVRGWIVFAVFWSGAFAYQYYSTEQLRKKAEVHAPYVGLEHAVAQSVDTETSQMGLPSMHLEQQATPWDQTEQLARKSRAALTYLFGGLILSAILCLSFFWILYGRKGRQARR
jgi:hypothetical protein